MYRWGVRQSERPPKRNCTDILLEEFPVVAPLLGSLDIRGRFVVGVGEETDNTEEDGGHGMHGQPAFTAVFIAILIVTWKKRKSWGWRQRRGSGGFCQSLGKPNSLLSKTNDQNIPGGWRMLMHTPPLS